MKLNNPTLNRPEVVTLWIAAILVLVGAPAAPGTIPALAAYTLWLVVLGFGLLALLGGAQGQRCCS